MKFNRIQNATFLRNFVFGVEDSVVSTVGLVSGIAIAGASQSTILLTGVVLIFVEAFSMGVGSFVSEESSESYMAQKEVSPRLSIGAGLVMFLSYFLSGFIPLLPYVALANTQQAFPVSIAASLIVLFFLGILGAHLSKTHLGRGGLKMMIVGGVAIALGASVGVLMNRFVL